MYCPNCGSKNTEQVPQLSMNIIKCKKCKRYIRIDFMGIDVMDIQAKEIKKSL